MASHDGTSDVLVSAQAGSLPGRMARLALVSAPLLLGLFYPGLVWLTVWWVFPLAAIVGPTVWPGLRRAQCGLYALGVGVAVWLPTAMSNPDLALPLCGTDAVGILIPAVAGTTCYAVIALAAVARNQPKLWVLAALAVPLISSPLYYWLLHAGIAAPVEC